MQLQTLQISKLLRSTFQFDVVADNDHTDVQLSAGHGQEALYARALASMATNELHCRSYSVSVDWFAGLRMLACSSGF